MCLVKCPDLPSSQLPSYTSGFVCIGGLRLSSFHPGFPISSFFGQKTALYGKGLWTFLCHHKQSPGHLPLGMMTHSFHFIVHLTPFVCFQHTTRARCSAPFGSNLYTATIDPHLSAQAVTSLCCRHSPRRRHTRPVLPQGTVSNVVSHFAGTSWKNHCISILLCRQNAVWA